MLCEQCLKSFVIPRLREDDIVVLQLLYNEDNKLPQTARHKDDIEKTTKLSRFCNMMALARLQAWGLINLQPWAKANNYYITDEGIKSLEVLTEKIGGE